MSSNTCLGIITALGNVSDLFMYALVFQRSGSLKDGKEIYINEIKEIINLGIVVQFSKLFLVEVSESSCINVIWGPLSEALLSFLPVSNFVMKLYFGLKDYISFIKNNISNNSPRSFRSLSFLRYYSMIILC